MICFYFKDYWFHFTIPIIKDDTCYTMTSTTTFYQIDSYWVNSRAAARKAVIKLKENFKAKILAVSLLSYVTYWLPFYEGPVIEVPGMDFSEPRSEKDLIRNEEAGITDGYEFKINYGEDPSSRDEVRKFLHALGGTPGFEFETFSVVMSSRIAAETFS